MTVAESDTHDHNDGHYAALSDRAVTFLERQGGRAHEDALIAFVFGRSASPALWRTLLQSALAGEPRLTYAPDGRWLLSGGTPGTAMAPESLLPRFVAVDVETTGLKPSRQRIIEVALVRYEHGVQTDKLDRLVNPRTVIPAYISKLTGLRDDDVADEPIFGDLARQIVEFIADDVIVGHNVGFDMGFLNAELQRARVARLVNESVDTLPLATRLLPGVRRPSLDRVAKAVGLAPRNIHRAGVDAEITAEVALRLEAEARRQGIESFEGLKELAATKQRAPRDKVGRGRSLVDRSLLDGVPKRPGVYLMRDADGAVLYVGKAKNLRERVGAYFSQPLGYARKMDGLLESVVRIDTEVVGSELEALLLESQLIRRYSPRYNTIMRSYEHYPFIKVTVGNRWPRVTLVKDRANDGARYFGPFRSRSAAKRTVEIINEVLPLRTCTRSFRDARSYGRPCMRLALGKCLGPCVDVSIAGEYRDKVHQLLRFLDGDDDALYLQLWKELEVAAEHQDFERAEKLRRNVGSLNGVVAGHRALRLAVEGDHLLLVVPRALRHGRELWLVLDGRIWSRLAVDASQDEDVVIGESPSPCSRKRDRYQNDASHGVENPFPVAGAGSVMIPNGSKPELSLMRSYGRYQRVGLPPISHDGLDDAHILTRWIAGNSGHPAIHVIDRACVHDAKYWTKLYEKALAVPQAELVLNVGGPQAHEDSGEEALTNDPESAMEQTVGDSESSH